MRVSHFLPRSIFTIYSVFFYVLTRSEGEVDQPVGYFAKVCFSPLLHYFVFTVRMQEKWSYDNHNLACIIVFPPHQRHGYGNLMIEFSASVFLTPMHIFSQPECRL